MASRTRGQAHAVPKKFEIAPQDRIELHEETAAEFFQAVLKLNLAECLITDESRLSDFSSCGMPDDLDPGKTLKELYAAWDEYIIPLICDRYGIQDVTPTILLIELFEKIER